MRANYCSCMIRVGVASLADEVRQHAYLPIDVQVQE